MCRNKFVGRILFLAILATSAFAVPQHGGTGQPSIVGDWKITFAVSGQTASGTLSFRMEGGDLVGNLVTAHTGPGTLRNLKWSDGKLTATCVFDHHDSIALSGELKHGELTGTFQTEGREGTWEATRGTASAASSNSQYAPYTFLIGTWDVVPQGSGAPVAVQRFTWGPNQSYIWSAGSLMMNGKEQPHFEGMLVWNGVHKNLDMLLAVDLQSGRAAEQGTLSLAGDGTIVREINGIFSEGVQPMGGTAVGPAGAIEHFRQTYQQQGPDTVITSVMHQTDKGWVPTFPGSDRLIMKRRSPQ
jgi:hypothetical protein